jgi:hypothetical protein
MTSIFVQKRIAMAKSWVKDERMDLCDLKQITSNISEANFAKMK